jgi:hypothetical protein
MIAEGDLTVEVAGDGWFRWKYTTITGAEYIGGRLHKQKAAARRDGRTWVKEQQGASYA